MHCFSQIHFSRCHFLQAFEWCCALGCATVANGPNHVFVFVVALVVVFVLCQYRMISLIRSVPCSASSRTHAPFHSITTASSRTPAPFQPHQKLDASPQFTRPLTHMLVNVHAYSVGLTSLRVFRFSLKSNCRKSDVFIFLDWDMGQSLKIIRGVLLHVEFHGAGC